MCLQGLLHFQYVLNASIRDLRYFAALIRGVNFGTVRIATIDYVQTFSDQCLQRALITITKSGFIVNVEEARTLLGEYDILFIASATQLGEFAL